MIKYIILFLVVLGIAGFTGWQYVDQFGWTISHVDARAATWGAFGDYIGGVMNPIVAGIGLIFFIITLKQNEKALNMSAEELRLTRDELKNATKAQSKIATLNEQELNNSISLRVIDETIRSHDSLHSTFLKLLRSTKVRVKFSEEIEKIMSIEAAMDEIFSSRKRCIINLSDNPKGFIFTLEELAEIAESVAFLYHDIKTMNYNSLRNDNSKKAYTIPGSHQDLINFCRFTALSSVFYEESDNNENPKGLLHHGMMISKVERIAHNLGTSIDSLTENFDEYSEIKYPQIYK